MPKIMRDFCNIEEMHMNAKQILQKLIECDKNEVIRSLLGEMIF